MKTVKFENSANDSFELNVVERTGNAIIFKNGDGFSLERLDGIKFFKPTIFKERPLFKTLRGARLSHLYQMHAYVHVMETPTRSKRVKSSSHNENYTQIFKASGLAWSVIPDEELYIIAK